MPALIGDFLLVKAIQHNLRETIDLQRGIQAARQLKSPRFVVYINKYTWNFP